MDIELGEKRRYMELNNLREEELTEQDLENVRFNVEYAQEHESQ